MPKYVKVPDPVIILDPASKRPLVDETGEPKPIFMLDVVTRLLFNEAWGSNYRSIKAALDIDKAFSTSNKVVELDDFGWQKLKELAEDPKAGYGFNPLIMPQLFIFLEAIVEASDVKPL
jgi:hypothetical protein